MFKIGNVEINGRFSLAPMAGVSDFAFREICSSMGAALTVTEMVSAKALIYKDEKTGSLLYSSGKDMPLACQIFGHEPDVMAEAAPLALEISGAQILDINMGCPVGKIVRARDGSALMNDLPLASSIIKAVKAAVSVPVTVKFRKGPDNGHVNAIEFAKMCEDSGADMICLHGRTRAQMYSGRADWTCIARVKEALAIPVIGNGDVVDGPSALRMMEETGCDAVMIARAARGNPWIFREAAAYLTNRAVPDRPSRRDVIRMLLRHARMLCECKGEKIGIREMRSHAAWYITGFPSAARVRSRIVRVNTFEELEQLLKKEYPYA